MPAKGKEALYLSSKTSVLNRTCCKEKESERYYGQNAVSTSEYRECYSKRTTWGAKMAERREITKPRRDLEDDLMSILPMLFYTSYEATRVVWTFQLSCALSYMSVLSFMKRRVLQMSCCSMIVNDVFPILDT
ncbi:hypothetical protein Peur_017430 [Populus x canadensis]